jgi:hypothetical protein
MVYSATVIKQCGSCGTVEDHGSSFCSHCGSSNWTGAPTYPAYAYSSRPAQAPTNFNSDFNFPYPQLSHQGTPTLVLPEHMPNNLPAGMARALTNLSDSHVPNFAHVRHEAPSVLRQKQVEMAKLTVILARERLFLLTHFIIFAIVNVIGLWLSVKCYNEFIGDEMTRLMIGCSPFWIFNILGLVCLVPIRGTREGIARLKDQIAHLKVSIEYGYLR